MDIEKLNQWLVLIANFGVIAGLVFLGVELDQNSRIAERELALNRADNLHGKFVEYDSLVSTALKISEVQGGSAVVPELMEVYEMSEAEAYQWWRYMFQFWLHEEADWIYNGRSSTDCDIAVLRFLDHQIFLKHQSNFLDDGFVACIETWYER